MGVNHDSQLMLMTDVDFPRFEIVFGGNDAFREALIIDAEEFIGVKSHKAKGKRITTFEVESINELEPVRFKEEIPETNGEEIQEEENSNDKPAELDEENASKDKEGEVIDNQKLIDDITGQMTLF